MLLEPTRVIENQPTAIPHSSTSLFLAYINCQTTLLNDSSYSTKKTKKLFKRNMQSIAALRRSILCTPSYRTCLLPISRVLSTTPCHSEPPQGEAVTKSTTSVEKEEIPDTNKPVNPVKNTLPISSVPKLKSTEVGPNPGPTFQQKRHVSSVLEDVSCVGVDGWVPLNGSKKTREEEKQEVTEEYREYYKDHKPSPLSEVEFADTRKPISRAIDGEKDDVWGGGGHGYYIRDTVDEALARAEAMFREARERGDPSLPHSQALQRKMRELYEMTEQKAGSFKSFS